jgi:hypothetical protein
MQCKHIYYILQHVMHCGQLEEFIHCPSWNWNEVQCLINHVMQIEFCPFYNVKHFPKWRTYCNVST